MKARGRRPSAFIVFEKTDESIVFEKTDESTRP